MPPILTEHQIVCCVIKYNKYGEPSKYGFGFIASINHACFRTPNIVPSPIYEVCVGGEMMRDYYEPDLKNLRDAMYRLPKIQTYWPSGRPKY